jgi:hypothetical protein
MSDYVVQSTSDTPEQVQAAQGVGKTAPAPAEDKTPIADKTAVETPVASETTETEAEENEGADDSASESEVEAEGDESEETPAQDGKTGKRKSGVKKLREKLSAKDQEIGFLRSELERARVAGAKEPEKVAEKTVKEDGKPSKDQFETHDEYVEALADWKVDQRLKAEKAAAIENQVKSEGQKRLETHAGRVQEFVKSHPDFQEVIQDLDDGPKVSLTVQEVILNSDNGPELMYQLAKNRKEFERINALPAIQAARELGKFESRFAKPSEEKPQPKTTKAPPPVKPVGARSGSASKDPGEMDFDEYKAWRAKGGGA